ncbi:MAG: DUF4982 domain-containing protein [Clostridia bacterium]|nr:DUF4982 domain-containing protein [Clostridia bacterium]
MGNITTLNNGWKFHLGDVPDADYMGYDDNAWRDVTVPHDWSVEHPFDKSNASGTGYLPGGTAWYRKHFVLPDDIKGKRVRITFGGVYKHSRVWINSNYLGGRAYGYSTFTFDISEFVRAGENVICVRVEHEQVADSRWFTGSGIYRDVTLEITDMSCFEKDGIFITTKNIDSGNARMQIEYKTLDCDETEFIIEDSEGNWIASAEGKNGCAEVKIPNARLWSPDSPYLYDLICHAFSNGVMTDAVTIPFGVRTIQFDADRGFFLNGINMKLKGVCVHHDAGALGVAVPPAVWERRLKKFKAVGCNAIRTAHNPPSADLLDLCDRLGLLVMDEAFDEWEGAKNKWWQGHNIYPPKRFGYAEDFPLWHKADLEAMVLRDRNHPCVILWSIGNEIDYPNDPYVTPLFDEVLGNNDKGKPAQERRYDDKKPDAGRLTTVAKELVDIAHNIDTTRPVLSALSFPELSTRTGFADVLDVSGYNYRESFYEEDHKRFPDRVIFGSENGHDPKAWYAVRDNDYICGQFLWTGIDFLGECRGWPLRISQAGMLDLCGNEKPLFYRRKALWTDIPFVKIAVSRGTKENTNVWTDNFCYRADEGETVQVSCYTNASKAELFLNGKSLGEKTLSDADGCRITWEIPFEKGTLTAKAEGAEDTLSTPEKAEAINFEAYENGSSIVQIEVSLLDRNGNFACEDEIIYYQLIGDGQILGIENGKPDDLTCYAEKYRATYNGKAIVYIRKGSITENLTLYAYTKSGLSCERKIKNG